LRAGRTGAPRRSTGPLAVDRGDRRKGLLERREDDADRRRRIVHITATRRPAIEEWLSPSTRAWRTALAPLNPAERDMVLSTLLAFEAALEDTP
jgi:DNA-binding MarR family transcriptional regulator